MNISVTNTVVPNILMYVYERKMAAAVYTLYFSCIFV